MNYYLRINGTVFRFASDRLAAYLQSVLNKNGPFPEEYGEEVHAPDLGRMDDAAVRALLERVKK